jgi:hypothetical protein
MVVADEQPPFSLHCSCVGSGHVCHLMHFLGTGHSTNNMYSQKCLLVPRTELVVEQCVRLRGLQDRLGLTLIGF